VKVDIILFNSVTLKCKQIKNDLVSLKLHCCAAVGLYIWPKWQ